MEFLKLLLPLGLGSTTTILIIVLIIVLRNPEKAEKWGAIFNKWLSPIIKSSRKKAVALDIQGRVNEFSKTIKKEMPEFKPVGIKIEWIEEEETPRDFFDKNRLIIRLRKFNDQNKNFVNASMVLLSRRFLTQVKNYISPSQKASLDLYAARKLFEKEKPQVQQQFFEDYFSIKQSSNEKIMELLEKYQVIEKVGLFFPVLVQELAYLGNKAFYKPKSIRSRIISEVNDLINFLRDYSNREIGDTKTPLCFRGTFTRCAIVIIAKYYKRERSYIDRFVHYIGTLVKDSFESIYLLGSAELKNQTFIRSVSSKIQSKYQFDAIFRKRFTAWLKVPNKKKRVETNEYMHVLRNREICRYYDEEAIEDIMQVNEEFQELEETLTCKE